MSNDYQHLLTKHGILSAFNISKKIKKSYLDKLKEKYANRGLSPTEMDQKIQHDIIKHTQKFIQTHEIPGLYPDDVYKTFSVPPKIRKLLMHLTEECLETCENNKITKEHMILFMQLFLHSANITNEDVLKFREKYGLDGSDDISSEEDDNTY